MLYENSIELNKVRGLLNKSVENFPITSPLAKELMRNYIHMLHDNVKNKTRRIFKNMIKEMKEAYKETTCMRIHSTIRQYESYKYLYTNLLITEESMDKSMHDVFELIIEEESPIMVGYWKETDKFYACELGKEFPPNYQLHILEEELKLMHYLSDRDYKILDRLRGEIK
jgi:hypothetical protein